MKKDLKFANKLKQLRLEKDLNQEELADAVNRAHGTNINKGMVSKWESGTDTPRSRNLVALALFLGVRVDWLLELTDQKYDERRD